MSKALYDSGVKGCSQSNIGNGYNNLQEGIKGWVSDENQHNFDRVKLKEEKNFNVVFVVKFLMKR